MNTLEGKNKVNIRLFISGFISVLVVYLIPRMILGQDSYVTINDNLDSEIIWRLILKESGLGFAFKGEIAQVMNGLPRQFMISGYNIVFWLFLIFKPFTAYVINEIIVHLIAYISMYILLKNHCILKKEDEFIVMGVSICFSFLPFLSIYGISIAAQPLVYHIFLNFTKRIGKIHEYMILLIYSLYSSLVLSGFFLIVLLIIFFLFLIIKERRINKSFLAGILLISISYLIIEYNLLNLLIINKDLVSHRIERNIHFVETGSNECYSLKYAFNFILKQFIWGHRYSPSLHFFILIIVFWSLILSVGYIKKSIRFTKYAFAQIIIIVTIFLISVFWGIYYWKGLIPLKKAIPLLAQLNLQRFHWLQPTLWYILFGLSLFVINYKRKSKIVSKILISLVLIYILNNGLKEGFYNELKVNYQILLNLVDNEKIITYREFVAENQFKEIAEFIGKPQTEYRVGSIGIHPSIAQFNNFYTIDGYQNNYPLQYKHKFRKIIAKELKKTKRWQKAFDYWGNRCYLISSEVECEYSSFFKRFIDFERTKEQDLKIRNLELNTEELLEFGCKYIISTYKIINAKDSALNLVSIFEDDESAWKIYLYRLIVDEDQNNAI